MYKNKDKQREANRASAKRYRKGMTQGMTVEHDNGQGMTPGILLKLTDPWWRGRMAGICDAFEHSHNPRYEEDVWLGNTNLSVACDFLECTR